MKTHHIISVLSGMALAMTALAATAENSGTWHIDDDLDIVVLEFPGSRDKYISSSARPEMSIVARNETWYYEEDSDNSVLNFPGSRDRFISSPESTVTEISSLELGKIWNDDEDIDTIVLNDPGSRDNYVYE